MEYLASFHENKDIAVPFSTQIAVIIDSMANYASTIHGVLDTPSPLTLSDDQIAGEFKTTFAITNTITAKNIIADLWSLESFKDGTLSHEELVSAFEEHGARPPQNLSEFPEIPADLVHFVANTKHMLANLSEEDKIALADPRVLIIASAIAEHAANLPGLGFTEAINGLDKDALLQFASMVGVSVTQAKIAINSLWNAEIMNDGVVDITEIQSALANAGVSYSFDKDMRVPEALVNYHIALEETTRQVARNFS